MKKLFGVMKVHILNVPNVNVDEKVYFITKTLLNIILNLILHETIICDDRDPPWINNEIKMFVFEKNLAFKSYCCSNRNMLLFKKFKAFHMPIEELKEKYYTKLSSRIADPVTSPKTYWSILKTFLNNKDILAYLLFFMKTNSLQTSRKKVNYLATFCKSMLPFK